MSSRAYRAVDVNRIEVARVLQGRNATTVHLGIDVGKDHVLCVLRWNAHDFDRPWRVLHPFEVTRLAELLRDIAQHHPLVVAMEPTGTYGDALRQALARVGIVVQRVSSKQASDFAEVFDGVPSQHDGKDAAVIAELAAQGRCSPWPITTASEVEQEIAYHVDWMDGQRRMMMVWCGRVEAMLTRHWPEATRVLKLSSSTLLHCLIQYGGPRGLAAAPDGVAEVKRWGRCYVSAERAQKLVASARDTVGVTMGSWDEERLRCYAREVRKCRQELQSSRRRLMMLTREHATIRALGTVVGVPTACVLWTELGDPKSYHCGPAYRKAMGLNLAERSSGRWQGKLKISKRGSSKVRRWLYMAALRWVRVEPVRSWYQRQKSARRGEGKPAVVGVMRKLALALYRVGGRGEPFDAKALYASLAVS